MAVTFNPSFQGAYQTGTTSYLDTKLNEIRTNPNRFPSGSIVHWADNCFNLKNLPNEQVKWQVFFAAFAYFDPYTGPELGSANGGQFFIDPLSPQDLAILYRIIFSYHMQYEKNQLGDRTVFQKHLSIMENRFKSSVEMTMQGIAALETFNDPALQGLISRLKEHITPLQNILNSVNSYVSYYFIEKKTTADTFSCITLMINPQYYFHQLSNPNKIYSYNCLTYGRPVGDQINMQTWNLNDPHSLDSLAIFPFNKPIFSCIDGPFKYDASTADTVHWTANFADTNLFGFCEGGLLAQDELQVLEHPALAHLKNAIPLDQRILKPYGTALFQNVPRLGFLDTSTPLANSYHSLYGNYFASATQSQIASRLTRFETPISSNIFAIAAPRIPSHLKGSPYKKKDIELLFYTFYNASRSMKVACPGKKIVVHTGNWGTGAFGNDPKTTHLLQLAAARCAGIDEIRMHPITEQTQTQLAIGLLQYIEQQHPYMTVGEFLGHLTAHARSYGLIYKQGNGT